MNNISWNQETKDHWVSVMQEHQTLDRLIQGNWTSGKDDKNIFKGCFFGCAMQTDKSPLDKAIEAMKLPAWLIYIAEKIFEGLPSEGAVLFPVQLLKSIPVNTDLTSVECNMHIERLSILADKNPTVKAVIDNVIKCYKMKLNGDSDIDWSETAELAWSAARSAWSAARSAESAESAELAELVWSAVWSAARSAESAELAARSAARSAESAARSAWSAAGSARSAAPFWQNERDTLIRLLKECK